MTATDDLQRIAQSPACAICGHPLIMHIDYDGQDECAMCIALDGGHQCPRELGPLTRKQQADLERPHRPYLNFAGSIGC